MNMGFTAELIVEPPKLKINMRTILILKYVSDILLEY